MAYAIEPTHLIRRSPEMIEANIQGEAMMMSITNGEYFKLEHIAAHIWDLIKKPKNVSDICRELRDRYDISSDQHEQNVIKSLDHLAGLNVVMIED